MTFLQRFNQTIIVLLVAVTSAYSQILRVDLDNANGGKVSDIFDSVEYIPLETNKESLFGSIDRLEIIDSFFIISDFFSTRSILVFKNTGEFHGKIKNIPNINYTIDRQLKRIYIYSNGKFYIYNMAGKLLKVVPFKVNGDMHNYTYAGAGNLIYISSKQEEDTMVCLLNHFNIFSTQSAQRPLLSIPIGAPDYYNTASRIMFTPFSSFFNWSGKQIFFSLRYGYNIFETNASGAAEKKYSFVFPLKNALPKQEIIDSIFTTQNLRVFSKGNNLIIEIPDFFRQTNNIAFSVVPSAIDNGYRKSFFLYSTKTNNLVSLKRITPDSSSFFLPVGQAMSGTNNGYYYSSLASYEMFIADGNKSKKASYPPSLQRYFNEESRTSNPVIIQLKAKDNF